MKICVLSEHFHPDGTSGTSIVLSNLLRHLKDSFEDLEIDVITSANLLRDEAHKLPRQEKWDGISIHRLQMSPPKAKSVRRRLLTNMLLTIATFRVLMRRRGKYDLVLVVTAPPTLPAAAWLFNRLTGTPYIYIVYDLYIDMALTMKIINKDSRSVRQMYKLQCNWFNGASKVVVIGRCMRDFVARRYRIDASKIEILPIPANLDRVKPFEGKTRFRRDNQLEGFLVLYSGNFALYQDFDTLLDAATHLKERRDITFIFVGDGASKESIASRVRNEELSNVKMYPLVPESELADLLASADVSLVSLKDEMVGLAVPSKFYNIMASGRPTLAVVNSKSEIAKVIEESFCGVQFNPGDSKALSSTIAALADDPERVAQMGQNARRTCEMKYSIEDVSRRFYEVFAKIVHHEDEGLNPTFAQKMHPCPAPSVPCSYIHGAPSSDRT